MDGTILKQPWTESKAKAHLSVTQQFVSEDTSLKGRAAEEFPQVSFPKTRRRQLAKNLRIGGWVGRCGWVGRLTPYLQRLAGWGLKSSPDLPNEEQIQGLGL